MKDFNKQLTEIYPKLEKDAKYVAIQFEVDPDDLLHDTIERALIKNYQFDGKNLAAWLKKIMINIAKDKLRKNSIKVESKGEDRKHDEATGKKTYTREKREVSYENEKPEDVKDNNKKIYLSDFDPKSPSAQELSSSLNQKKEQEILEVDEKIIGLYNSISKLGKKCQEIFRLHMVVEGSFLELSKRMNIPLGTVQSRFYRCKEKLLKIILKESPGEANEI